MSIWNLFNKAGPQKKEAISLKSKLSAKINTQDDQQLTLIACVSGLLARVAYCDFKISESEITRMQSSLKKWTSFSESEISIIVELASSEIKELAGLEDYYYCKELLNIMDMQDRYKIIESLFHLAAADGKVESKEEEEIRQICKHLQLSHKHFLSARSQVIEYLGSLQI